VHSSLPTPTGGNGCAIIRWPAAASEPRGGSGDAAAPVSIFRSALAMAIGSPVSRAPSVSAPYSRPDGAAICSTSALNGLSPTSDATPADHDDTATSRRMTCESSWARTARSSAGFSSRSRPSVQHTAAERGP
jgi:hypothetical protein